MRIKASLLLSLLVLAMVAAHSSDGSDPQSRAVTTTQLAAWLTGGVSSSRLARVVAERGLATLPTNNELKQLESAGAGKDLMKVVSSGNALSAGIGPAIPRELLKATADVGAQRFHEAEVELRGVMAADDENPALHFALGVVLRQQDKFDDAYDGWMMGLMRFPRHAQP